MTPAVSGGSQRQGRGPLLPLWTLMLGRCLYDASCLVGGRAPTVQPQHPTLSSLQEWATYSVSGQSHVEVTIAASVGLDRALGEDSTGFSSL